MLTDHSLTDRAPPTNLRTSSLLVNLNMAFFQRIYSENTLALGGRVSDRRKTPEAPREVEGRTRERPQMLYICRSCTELFLDEFSNKKQFYLKKNCFFQGLSPTLQHIVFLTSLYYYNPHKNNLLCI